MLICHALWSQHATDTVFTHVEKMPVFGDCAGDAEEKKCSDLALVNFISHHLVYPEAAIANNVEGTVYVNFIVDETGHVLAPTLLMDIGDGCGAAALAVINAMPDWQPGYQDGHAVKVKLNLPIQFSLRNAQQTIAERYTITWGDIVGDTVTLEQLKSNLPFSVYVRGPEGNTHYVDELSFMYTSRNRRQTSAISRGGISEELVAIVEKVKVGGNLTITASIQDNGRFISVNRVFQVVANLEASLH